MTEKHIKMFKLLIVQRNAIQNDPEILPYTNQDAMIKTSGDDRC